VHTIDLHKSTRFFCLTMIMVFSCSVLASCIFDPRLREVTASLNNTIAELPAPEEMKFVGDIPVKASLSVIDSSACTYAEYFRAYGTKLTSTEALDLYVEQLEKANWNEVEKTDNSRFLVRGKSETLNIATYPMSGWYVSELDPDNRRADYPTVLHLRLFIAFPQREGC